MVNNTNNQINNNVTQGISTTNQVDNQVKMAPVVNTNSDSQATQQAIAAQVASQKMNNVASMNQASNNDGSNSSVNNTNKNVAKSNISKDNNVTNISAVSEGNDATKSSVNAKANTMNNGDNNAEVKNQKVANQIQNCNNHASNVATANSIAVNSVSKTVQGNKNLMNSDHVQSQKMPVENQKTPVAKAEQLKSNTTVRYNLMLNEYKQARDVNAVPNRSIGIDVSDYQNNDIINKMKANGAKYVIVKTSEGMSNDGAVNAESKIKLAEADGMEVQGYHFAHFGGNESQAVSEAVHAVANAEYYGLPKGSYLACDYETDASGSVAANTAAVEAFMNRVKAEGYQPLLYSGAYYMKSHLNVNDIVNKFGTCLWVASYPTTGYESTPDFNYFPSMNGILMWQFSDDEDGLNVDGDVNVLPLTGQTIGASSSNIQQSAPVSNNGQSNGDESTYTDALGVTWHCENGSFTTNTAINLRWGATPSSSLVTTLPAGSTVNYDAWCDSDGYIWLQQPRANGTDGYLVAGLDNGSQKYGQFNNATDAFGSHYTGQKQVDGKWQYWNNGQAVKNNYVWIADQNKECYYDNNGNMVYGQQNIWGHWQYFDPETGAQAKNKYVWLGNKECYYDGNGNMVYGQQDINGHWQYFDLITGAQAKNQYVWIADQDKECYYDGNGNMVYGQQQINGYWQYFDPNTGAQVKNAYVWIPGQNKECYYDASGNMVYGQQKINGYWQYFDPETGAQAKNQYVWIANQNKEVYYDGNGNMVYGWQKIDGQQRYFDPVTGAQAKSCEMTIGGTLYRFDGQGTPTPLNHQAIKANLDFGSDLQNNAGDQDKSTVDQVMKQGYANILVNGNTVKVPVGATLIEYLCDGKVVGYTQEGKGQNDPLDDSNATITKNVPNGYKLTDSNDWSRNMQYTYVFDSVPVIVTKGNSSTSTGKSVNSGTGTTSTSKPDNGSSSSTSTHKPVSDNQPATNVPSQNTPAHNEPSMGNSGSSPSQTNGNQPQSSVPVNKPTSATKPVANDTKPVISSKPSATDVKPVVDEPQDTKPTIVDKPVDNPPVSKPSETKPEVKPATSVANDKPMVLTDTKPVASDSTTTNKSDSTETMETVPEESQSTITKNDTNVVSNQSTAPVMTHTVSGMDQSQVVPVQAKTTSVVKSVQDRVVDSNMVQNCIKPVAEQEVASRSVIRPVMQSQAEQVASQQANAVQVATNVSENEGTGLPQTGETKNSLFGMIGAMMVGLGTMFGLKRKKRNI